MQPYLTGDIQSAGSSTVTIAAGTSVQVSPSRDGALRRTQITITNNTTGSTIRVNKGIIAASATIGIPITVTQTYLEGDDGGYTCFQGGFNVYADVQATVTITETLEPRGR